MLLTCMFLNIYGIIGRQPVAVLVEITHYIYRNVHLLLVVECAFIVRCCPCVTWKATVTWEKSCWCVTAVTSKWYTKINIINAISVICVAQFIMKCCGINNSVQFGWINHTHHLGPILLFPAGNETNISKGKWRFHREPHILTHFIQSMCYIVGVAEVLTDVLLLISRQQCNS